MLIILVLLPEQEVIRRTQQHARNANQGLSNEPSPEPNQTTITIHEITTESQGTYKSGPNKGRARPGKAKEDVLPAFIARQFSQETSLESLVSLLAEKMQCEPLTNAHQTLYNAYSETVHTRVETCLDWVPIWRIQWEEEQKTAYVR